MSKFGVNNHIFVFILYGTGVNDPLLLLLFTYADIPYMVPTDVPYMVSHAGPGLIEVLP